MGDALSLCVRIVLLGNSVCDLRSIWIKALVVQIVPYVDHLWRISSSVTICLRNEFACGRIAKRGLHEDYRIRQSWNEDPSLRNIGHQGKQPTCI